MRASIPAGKCSIGWSGSAATIYTIGLYDTDDPDRNPGILRELAHISGGEAYFPESPPDTIPVCRRIAHDIRTRYTIGYVPRREAARMPCAIFASSVDARGTCQVNRNHSQELPL